MTELDANGNPYEKSGFRDIPAWYRALCDKYPNPTIVKEGSKIRAMEEKEHENLRKKDNPMLQLSYKNIVSHVIRAMPVDTKEAQENFRKLLCYFLICFYVDAPSDDVGDVHHFADVADLEKFEKICSAQVMLRNIVDYAGKVSYQSDKSYITCNSSVVEVRFSLCTLFFPFVNKVVSSILGISRHQVLKVVSCFNTCVLLLGLL
ncbi:hypothetical protein BVRB_018170 [Beta vulgaris subsp. vulgaris]|uniref:Uncharacterized protein n=1 Tax=Beta vulgaris subsp. vulgaris TaxID=3555 RepID=A0A0J7YND7_BETVV|nr:hypothetical protein BVRB_018170 [Beta vulgaris subsp. vulgaris]